MTQSVTAAEIDERLRSLGSSLIVGPEDARALEQIVELRIPAVARPAAREARSSRRHVVRFGAVATAIAFVMLANLVAAYYAPTYSRALADAPGIGGPTSIVLAAFGLNAGNITAINDSATSSGHTVRLASGYADGLRTVLFVSVDGKGLEGNPKGFGMNPGDYGLGEYTLSDQFGRYYEPHGVGGPTMIPFTPLLWPASSVGARLTLHVTSIDAIWLRGGGEVRGDWSLHATLVAEPAHTLDLPAPVHTSQANYTFTSIRSTATTLSIHWTVDGAVLDQEKRLRAPAGSWMSAEYMQLQHDYFWPEVFDAAGRPVQLSDWGITFTRPATGEITVCIPGPGRYRVQLGAALTADYLERWIVVP